MTAPTAVPPSPTVAAGAVHFGNRLPLALIAGPCMLESRGHALEMAGALKEIAARLRIRLLYKNPLHKANPPPPPSARGLRLRAARAVVPGITAPPAVP